MQRLDPVWLPDGSTNKTINRFSADRTRIRDVDTAITGEQFRPARQRLNIDPTVRYASDHMHAYRHFHHKIQFYIIAVQKKLFGIDRTNSYTLRSLLNLNTDLLHLQTIAALYGQNTDFRALDSTGTYGSVRAYYFQSLACRNLSVPAESLLGILFNPVITNCYIAQL